MDKIEIIESHLIRLIEDVAVVKSRLSNLDELNMRVEASLGKMEQQTIKIETTAIEINSLKDKVNELDRRMGRIEDTMKNDTSDTNNAYRNTAFAIIATVLGTMILYFIRPI